jgi:hypothetical protein
MSRVLICDKKSAVSRLRWGKSVRATAGFNVRALPHQACSVAANIELIDQRWASMLGAQINRK